MTLTGSKAADGASTALASKDLIDAWAGQVRDARAGQTSFSVLDLDFGDARHWRAAHAAWRADAQRPRLLHYVAHAPALPPGFQRESFDDGQVMLTRCGGLLANVLKELRFAADAVVLPLHASLLQTLDVWAVKLLARCCRRGTLLRLTGAVGQASPAALENLVPLLLGQGFEQHTRPELYRYNPRWEPKTRGSLKTQRFPPAHGAAPGDASNARRCLVIGAGLAGASSAYAMARRGWAVQVLDAHPQPAMGASSLPAGLLAAHTSADDNHRSRLSRAGLQMSLEQARRLLVAGQDWQHSGVLTLKPGAAPRHHADAAWIKPQALIKAWLAAPGIRFTGGVTVAALRQVPSAVARFKAGPFKAGEPSDVASASEPPGDALWELLDAAGQVIAQAPLVVVAAAGASTALLRDAVFPKGIRPFGPLTEVPGQVSWGLQRAGDSAWLPAWPVNGLGSFLADIPHPGDPGHPNPDVNPKALAWLLAATFEDAAHPLNQATAHLQNLARLQQLLPGTAAHLQARFSAGEVGDVGKLDEVKAWRGTRCTTPSRLPIVAELAHGLWLNTGYGSRGLTWSVLCAELLAARWLGEPWPMEASLARGLG